MSAKRFRVALSFAGDTHRAFVADVARILASRFGEAAILYDKFHQAEFSRSDLAFYLPGLYENDADLVVAVFCRDYDKKEWCGLEWNAIFGMLKSLKALKASDVMLTRFDRVEGKGLHGLAGYTDFDGLTPAQAADGILERLGVNEGRPKDFYTAGAGAPTRRVSTVIPNNLPRLEPFFGREKELAAIREALDPESRTWGALIDGPGGMGKTSLAVRAAYDCTPDQFDRIVFVSVKDRELDDDGVRQLGSFILPGLLEMLNELARELGQPAIAKAPEDQRIRLLLDALRSTQTLLILDNLESLTKDDRGQLLTFVKRLPQDCKAILTSRRRIGSGSELLILEKLDEAAALDTLAELARHNPLLAKTSEAEHLTLYVQTGGKPLLLRWVAGQLGRGRCRTFTDALHFLGSCPPDNDPLEFIFGDLAQEFTAEETLVLVALTYFATPAQVEHIATLAGLEGEPVASALDALANRSLVVPDQEEKNFALVPMVAEFLRRKRPDVVKETSDKLEQRAYALIIENGYGNFERFSAIDAAWPTVAPALPLFLSGPNPRLQTVCDALRQFLEFSGRWDESLSLFERAEIKAVAAADHSNAGSRSLQLGWIHYLRGRADAVLACADRASAHWQAGGAGAKNWWAAIRLRGIGHQLKQDYVAAIAAYSEALDLLRNIAPQSKDVAAVLNDLSSVEKRSGDLAASERDLGEALRVAVAIKDSEGVALYTSNLAGRALTRKDWPAAETLAREALKLAENVGRQELIALSELRLATALIRQMKNAAALPHARRGVAIYTQLRSSELELAQATLRACEEHAGTS